MEIRTIATDLGKTVFHLACVNARGEVVVVRKKCSRTAVVALHLEPSRVPDRHEACGCSTPLFETLESTSYAPLGWTA